MKGLTVSSPFRGQRNDSFESKWRGPQIADLRVEQLEEKAVPSAARLHPFDQPQLVVLQQGDQGAYGAVLAPGIPGQLREGAVANNVYFGGITYPNGRTEQVLVASLVDVMAAPGVRLTLQMSVDKLPPGALAAILQRPTTPDPGTGMVNGMPANSPQLLGTLQQAATAQQGAPTASLQQAAMGQQPTTTAPTTSPTTQPPASQEPQFPAQFLTGLTNGEKDFLITKWAVTSIADRLGFLALSLVDQKAGVDASLAQYHANGGT